MEVIAMENNNLKEQVRKDVKEKIAVSNIRKEFDMKSKNNKKLIYWVSSICAVFVLCFSLLISIDFLNNDSNTEIAKIMEQKIYMVRKKI